MCRGKNDCSELGTTPSAWNKQCLLPLPEWADDQISLFTNAVSKFIEGDRNGCLDTISQIRNSELIEWFIEHGQMSGRHRKLALNVQNPNPVPVDLRDPLRGPKKYQEAVFKRDEYRCRYCGTKLISQKTMKAFIKKLNSKLFYKGSTNLTTHGIIHITWPVADHVLPWNLGGRTNLENLVSSCGPCNYGKDGYTCEELGIENPFNRPPLEDSWDGLESLLKEIKLIA